MRHWEAPKDGGKGIVSWLSGGMLAKECKMLARLGPVRTNTVTSSAPSIVSSTDTLASDKPMICVRHVDHVARFARRLEL